MMFRFKPLSMLIFISIFCVLYSSVLFGSAIQIYQLRVVSQEEVNGVKRDIGWSKDYGAEDIEGSKKSGYTSLDSTEIYGGVSYPMTLYISNKWSAMDSYARIQMYKWFATDIDGSYDIGIPVPFFEIEYSDSAMYWPDVDVCTARRFVGYFTPRFDGFDYSSDNNKVLEDTTVARKYMTALCVNNQIYAPMLEEIYEDNGKYIYHRLDKGNYVACLQVSLENIQSHNVDDASWSSWQVQLDTRSDKNPSISDTEVHRIWHGRRIGD